MLVIQLSQGLRQLQERKKRDSKRKADEMK